MTDPIQLFLSSFWKLKLELFTWVVLVVVSWFTIFTVVEFVFDIIGFELDKFKRWYFDKRTKNRHRNNSKNLT